MRASDLIQKKRDGKPLTAQGINSFIKGYTAGDIPDYQASAFAMAIFFQGMENEEIANLTQAMLHSGKILDFSYLDGPVIDKHSTGGVGDKSSIPLAPAVAACGIFVPMISGRGLGHTGGTLDKLETIPGFNTQIPIQDFKKLVESIGCCLIGQTKEIAPADKKLYALRDVTATTECLPLIISSIMSKKLAEGIDGLFLDVKYGSGAFFPDHDDAEKLALNMVDIGRIMGKKMTARLSDMSQPLGQMVGNALEIEESLDILNGEGPADLKEHVLELGGEMLLLGEKVKTIKKGRALIKEVLQNGKALQKFAEIIKAQGGNSNIVSDKTLLPKSNKKTDFVAKKFGYLKSIDTKKVGISSMLLGGGRQKVTDKIDPRVGLKMHVRIGDKIQKDQPLCTLYLGEKDQSQAFSLLEKSFIFSDEIIQKPKLFSTRITS